MQAMSPSSTQHDVPKPRFEWETSNILKLIPVNSRPVRPKAVCRSSDGAEQSIWLDDLIDRCPRKGCSIRAKHIDEPRLTNVSQVAPYFQKIAITSYEKEMIVA